MIELLVDGDRAALLYECDVPPPVGTIRTASFQRVEGGRIPLYVQVFDATELREGTRQLMRYALLIASGRRRERRPHARAARGRDGAPHAVHRAAPAQRRLRRERGPRAVPHRPHPASDEGGPLFTDGPFAESREQSAGTTYLEAADLDEAIAWAWDMPAWQTVAAAVEFRPCHGRAAPTEGSHLLAIRGGDAEALLRWGAEAFAPPGSATTLRMRDGARVLTDQTLDPGLTAIAGGRRPRAARPRLPGHPVKIRSLRGGPTWLGTRAPTPT